MRNQVINTKLVTYNYLTGNKVELTDDNGDYTGEIVEERSVDNQIRVVLIKNKGKVMRNANGVLRAYDATAVHMGSKIIPDGALVLNGSDTYIVDGALESVNHTKYYLVFKDNG